VTTAEHLAQRGIRSGFDFLLEPAGFALGESLLPFDAGDTTLRLRRRACSTPCAWPCPARRWPSRSASSPASGGWPTTRWCAASPAPIDAFRNVPLLLQLLAWYFILTDLLPAADAALRLAPGVFLSKSGLALPWWGDGGFEIPSPPASASTAAPA
jgi:general L-amino acid transport system permease protein